MRTPLIVSIFVLGLAACDSSNDAANPPPTVPESRTDETPNTAQPAATDAGGSFRMPVADVFTISGKGSVITGRIESGSVSTGMFVCVPLKSGAPVARKVTGIEQFRKVIERADAGEMVGIMIDTMDRNAVDKDGELNTDCE